MYSYRDHAWKIADFGITTEGSSGRAYTTHYSRGTNGYRAPELLREARPTYSNKVDIWAMGCIFYELVMRKKVFEIDFSTREYCLSGQPIDIGLTFDDFPDFRIIEMLRKIVQDMLEVDPLNRPRAIEIHQRLIMRRIKTVHQTRPNNDIFHNCFSTINDVFTKDASDIIGHDDYGIVQVVRPCKV
jgi:serine/threonine protein kinase